MKLSRHFKLEEFHCKDGTKYPEVWIPNMLKPMISELEEIRALTNQPCIIVSGYRTKSYNSKVHGASKSQHIIGNAVDITLKGMTKVQLYKAICHLIKEGVIKQGGVGLYNTHVHYDRRGTPARWNKSKWRV